MFLQIWSRKPPNWQVVDSLAVCGEYRVVILATPFFVMYTTRKHCTQSWAWQDNTMLRWAEHTMIYWGQIFKFKYIFNTVGFLVTLLVSNVIFSIIFIHCRFFLILVTFFTIKYLASYSWWRSPTMDLFFVCFQISRCAERFFTLLT